MTGVVPRQQPPRPGSWGSSPAARRQAAVAGWYSFPPAALVPSATPLPGGSEAPWAPCKGVFMSLSPGHRAPVWSQAELWLLDLEVGSSLLDKAEAVERCRLPGKGSAAT